MIWGSIYALLDTIRKMIALWRSDGFASLELDYEDATTPPVRVPRQGWFKIAFAGTWVGSAILESSPDGKEWTKDDGRTANVVGFVRNDKDHAMFYRVRFSGRESGSLQATLTLVDHPYFDFDIAPEEIRGTRHLKTEWIEVNACQFIRIAD